MTSTDQRSSALEAAIATAEKAGAEQVEVSYAGSELQFARFANSRFTQVGNTSSGLVRVRVLVGNKLGSQTCDSLDTSQIESAARGAVEIARLTPKLDVDLAFADSDRADPVEAPPIDEKMSAIEAPSRLKSAFDAAGDGVHFAGALKAKRRHIAVRTNRGVSLDFGHGLVDLAVIAIASDEASGFAGAAVPAGGAIDFEAVARRAADKARRGLDPVDVSPEAMDVVLAPEAVAEILEWMATASIGGDSVQRKSSLLADREGVELCDSAITICDRLDDHEPPFDAEGTRAKPVTFIDAGRGGKPVTDRLFALRLGDPRGSTGHAPAQSSDFESFGPTPTHLRLAVGEKSEDELIAAVDRGLYITRFHYVNGLLDTRRATMTGMTRDGTFLIEGGKLTRPVRNLRFTESMLEAFSRLGGIGKETRDVPTWWSGAGVISAPPMLIRQFHFTGSSRK
jgi:predicted Zn-dependent protease